MEQFQTAMSLHEEISASIIKSLLSLALDESLHPELRLEVFRMIWSILDKEARDEQ